MRIVCTNEQQSSLKEPWMDEPVEFAATGTARVTRDVGERLVEEVADIEPYESEDNT